MRGSSGLGLSKLGLSRLGSSMLDKGRAWVIELRSIFTIYSSFFASCDFADRDFAERERNANSLRYSRMGRAGVPQKTTPLPRITFFVGMPLCAPRIAPASMRT